MKLSISSSDYGTELEDGPLSPTAPEDEPYTPTTSVDEPYTPTKTSQVFSFPIEEPSLESDLKDKEDKEPELVNQLLKEIEKYSLTPEFKILVPLNSHTSLSKRLNSILYYLVKYNRHNIIDDILKKSPYFSEYIQKIKNSALGYDITFFDKSKSLIETAINFDNIETLKIFAENSWELDINLIDSAITNHSEKSLKFLLSKIKLTQEERLNFANKACSLGNISMVKSIFPENDFFYIQYICSNILPEEMNEQKIEEKFYHFISLALRFSNFSDVLSLRIPTKINHRETIIKAYHRAKQDFMSWGNQIAKYRNSRDLSEISYAYTFDPKDFHLISIPEGAIPNIEQLQKYSQYIPLFIKSGPELWLYGLNTLGEPQLNKFKNKFGNYLDLDLDLKLEQKDPIPDPLRNCLLIHDINAEIKTYKLHVKSNEPKKILEQDIEFGKANFKVVEAIFEEKTLADFKISEDFLENFPLPKEFYDKNGKFHSMRLLLNYFAIAHQKEAESRNNGDSYLFISIQTKQKSGGTSLINNRYDHMLKYVELMNNLAKSEHNTDPTLKSLKEGPGYELHYKGQLLSCVSFDSKKGWHWKHGQAENRQEIWLEIEKLHKQILETNTQEILANPSEFYNKVVEVAWLMGNLTPMQRGTGRYIEQWLAYIHLYHNLPAPVLRPGFQLDCMDITFSLNHYKKIFLAFFEPESLHPLVKHQEQLQSDRDLDKKFLMDYFQLTQPKAESSKNGYSFLHSFPKSTLLDQSLIFKQAYRVKTPP